MGEESTGIGTSSKNIEELMNNIPEDKTQNLTTDPNYGYNGTTPNAYDAAAFMTTYDINDPTIYMTADEIRRVFNDRSWIVEHAEQIEAVQAKYNISAFMICISCICESGATPNKNNSLFGCGNLTWDGTKYVVSNLNGAHASFSDPVESLWGYGLWWNYFYLQGHNAQPDLKLDTLLKAYCTGYRDGGGMNGDTVYPKNIRKYYQWFKDIRS